MEVLAILYKLYAKWLTLDFKPYASNVYASLDNLSNNLAFKFIDSSKER